MKRDEIWCMFPLYINGPKLTLFDARLNITFINLLFNYQFYLKFFENP